MDAKKRILVLHDRDRVGRAVVRQLQAAQVPLCEIDQPLPADEIVSAAFGCRAIVAVGDRFAADPAVLSAASMPGVRSLVLVVRSARDFSTLRKHGVPYTVIQTAPLLEELITALEPTIATGRLVLDGTDDASLAFVAADDVAACAIVAIDHDDYCGRIVDLAAPGDFTVSTLATAIARARGQRLKVSAWPRWVIAGMRALGRAPFRLPAHFVAQRPTENLTPLHPAPWRTVEQVAAPASERSNDHALGMH